MKLRNFIFMICIVLMFSVVLVSCNKNDGVSENTESDTVESTSETESETEVEYPDSNKAQGDRENDEPSKEYLDYYKEVNDDKMMHVTFE